MKKMILWLLIASLLVSCGASVYEKPKTDTWPTPIFQTRKTSVYVFEYTRGVATLTCFVTESSTSSGISPDIECY